MASNTPITKLAVHCSASPPNVYVDAAVIDRWHRQKGWFKIGYHYVIKRDGTVETGRKEEEIGAHVEGHNTGSLGICVVGGVNAKGKAEANFTPEQYASLERLLKDLLKKYPKAEILGHRDFPGVKKDCPSFDVKAWWAARTEKSLKG